MARKIKEGLDYFPHNCSYDDELKYIIAAFKANGYMVYFELLKKIYSGYGYYMYVNKKVVTLFSNEINVDINLIDDIIKECLSENLFCKSIYNKFEILTSYGIQKRYFEAIKRRKECDIIKDYLLINVDIYIDNANINYSNVSKSTQSKVKESKVKKSKVFIPPNLNEVIEYFSEKGYKTEIAKRAFEYYNVATWKDSKGNQVMNWKQKMNSVWFKEENKVISKIGRNPVMP